jgi:hypothetical protein
VTKLVPGKAYWVKVAAPGGKLVFSNPLLDIGGSSLLTGNGAAELLNSLTITDGRGRTQTLYFGSDESRLIKTSLYDVPPLPPAGAFDARFTTESGGSLVRTHGANTTTGVAFPITVQTEAYPLTISWRIKNGAYALMDDHQGRTLQPRELLGVGSMTITNPALSGFMLALTGEGLLPKEFALAQNYPNPFNPATTINYDLPYDTRVILKVFNVLGQQVATLLNEDQKAGYRSVVWNGTGFASGIYYYRLEAGTFSGVKKLVLMK